MTVIGDNKSNTVNILGDKLYNKNSIINSLIDFKLTDPICESF